MKVERLSRAVATAIAVLAVSVIPAVAQVGHSPFQPPATPIAGDAPAWQVAEVIPLDIPGMAVALSPDGTTIAGLDGDGAPCFWTVEGLEQTCGELPADGPPLRIDPDSIAWAPDSSAIAYATHAYRYGTDGDLYVVDAATAAITNITDDGIERASLFDDDQSTPIDVSPAWTPDSQAIVFSRTVWDDRDELSTEIMRVSREGGEPEELLSLPGLPAAIFTAMRVLSDGSVVYTVAFNDQDEPANGLWLLAPDGEATQLVPGSRGSEFPAPVINDVREAGGEIRIVGHSFLLAGQIPQESRFTFVWSSSTGVAVPVEAVSDDPDVLVYAGALSPDGQTVLSLERALAAMPQVSLDGPASSLTELPEFETEGAGWRPSFTSATWSNANLVLLAPYLTPGAYLVVVEPVRG